MARASNIYVVTDYYDRVIAAFTVKYECAAWLRTDAGLEALYIHRMPDNTRGNRASAQVWTPEELLV